MPLIDCQNVTFTYDGRPAVKDISLTVERGDYLCIVGENGSGKSTLVKGMLGLLKPVSGRVTFDSVRRTEIGYMPQQTIMQKDFPASVFEVVLSGCLNQQGFMPFYSPKDKARAHENMDRLGIAGLKRQSYRNLSIGQQQRVRLARALCATEKLLLLDEPVAGLDPMMTSELYALIAKLNTDAGITIIMVSHDIKSAVAYGNKILHMETSPLFFGLTTDYVQTDVCRKMMGVA